MVVISRPYEPFIPENIIVHMGRADEPAERVVVPFLDYIKAVVSREIYPTWPESAIRANIISIITLVLNRVYTEWYRSQGYDFDITNVGIDPKYEEDSYIFDNIDRYVDEMFNSFLVRDGFIEPIAAQYCDGVEIQCEGLSQWESVALARRGVSTFNILRHFFGNNINLLRDVPVMANYESYPLYPLKLGSFGRDVTIIQNELNRIAKSYPSIPPIVTDQSGIFGVETEAAVKRFQEIFNLPVDGIVGNATWYGIKRVYNEVKGLGDLISEGIRPEEVTSRFRVALQEGDTGLWVRIVQYYLKVFSCYYPDIPPVEITGVFDTATTEAIRALDRKFNLIEDGVVGIQTWGLLDRVYKEIMEFIPEGCLVNQAIYPGYVLSRGMGDRNVRQMQEYLLRISQEYPSIPRVNLTGIFDDETEAAVIAVQREFREEFGSEPKGWVGPITWSIIASLYENIQGGAAEPTEQPPEEVPEPSTEEITEEAPAETVEENAMNGETTL
ncbi:MAG: spore cortex-lytic protein [Epulopiscium sp.]|nr:spore cortex-lytic protein [Candidatus Epulonipiscium sp.]